MDHHRVYSIDHHIVIQCRGASSHVYHSVCINTCTLLFITTSHVSSSCMYQVIACIIIKCVHHNISSYWQVSSQSVQITLHTTLVHATSYTCIYHVIPCILHYSCNTVYTLVHVNVHTTCTCQCTYLHKCILLFTCYFHSNVHIVCIHLYIPMQTFTCTYIFTYTYISLNSTVHSLIYCSHIPCHY